MDLDSTICEVYGLAKQGAARGYTGVRGYHPLLASCAGDATGGGATQLLHTRLRAGNAGSGRGAGSFVAEVLARLRDALPANQAGRQGQVMLRADSGFYSREVIRACRRGGARFSVTVRMNPSVRRAIAAIPEQAWTPIPYWSSEGTFGHDEDGTPVSGADVAETAYTAFAGTRDAIEVRLVVRRVRPTPGSQLALDVAFSYHAFITDRDGELLDIEADHRRHAVVEQVIADLKGGCGLAHLPSGRFTANAGWLALVGLAYNLGRWSAALTSPRWRTITTATLRTRLLAVPARIVHTARRLHLRLPRALAVGSRLPAAPRRDRATCPHLTPAPLPQRAERTQKAGAGRRMIYVDSLLTTPRRRGTRSPINEWGSSVHSGLAWKHLLSTGGGDSESLRSPCR